MRMAVIGLVSGLIWGLLGALSYTLPATAQSPMDYQKAANEALQSQLSKEGKDCLDARDNYEDKLCIGQVAQQTKEDLGTFYQNLKALLDPANQKGLEEAQQEWLSYSRKSCDAIGELFREGSARAGLVARCEIRLTRSRMKDLDAIYNLPLHH